MYRLRELPSRRGLYCTRCSCRVVKLQADVKPTAIAWSTMLIFSAFVQDHRTRLKRSIIRNGEGDKKHLF
jgi:hypothetical protein